MKLKVPIYVFFIIILISCGKDTNDIEAAKSVIEKFYFFDKNGDYKSIDKLIATQFYRITPYHKLVDFLETRKSSIGILKEKELESYNILVSTNSKTQILMHYRINYELKTVRETFLLEKRKNVFKIMEYKVE